MLATLTLGGFVVAVVSRRAVRVGSIVAALEAERAAHGAVRNRAARALGRSINPPSPSASKFAQISLHDQPDAKRTKANGENIRFI